jgi:hypothetical protein
MKQLIDEVIDLRNRVHEDDFRFVLTPDHWKVLYVPENAEKSNLATVRNSNGKLKGYAAFYRVNFEEIKAYDVREIIAEDENTLNQLLDQIANRGMQDDVDFIFLKRCEEPFSQVFSEKGFFPFIESVIMIALFDPHKLLSALSEKVENGKVLRLIVKGFDHINIKIGEKGIMVAKAGEPNVIVSTDSKTFIRLFFNRTSFLKEFLRGRVTISGIFGLALVSRFFKVVSQRSWYIPMGDWV